ncbi:hypothetical protein Tco_0218222 [Tanacetum coccineum]
MFLITALIALRSYGNLPLIHLEFEELELDRRELDKQEVEQPEVDRLTNFDAPGLVQLSLIKLPSFGCNDSDYFLDFDGFEREENQVVEFDLKSGLDNRCFLG